MADISFDANYYYEQKLNQLQSTDSEQYGDWTIDDVTLSFQENGLTAAEHYEKYGVAEGLNPSAEFDTQAYLSAKLGQLQEQESEQYADWTVEDVAQAFADNGLSPLEHFNQFGQDEGLEAVPAGDNTSDLTEALTNLSDANADVAASLAAAAETVNASEDTPKEGDALKDFVEQFDADQLETAITDAEGDIATAEAKINTETAELLSSRADTFSGTSFSSEASALVSGVAASAYSSAVDANGDPVSGQSFDLGIEGSDRLTDANIAKALQEAQKAVNADKAQYTVSGAGSTASASLASTGDVSGSTETFTAKALQIQAGNAESELNADESANGSNVELLTNLRSAIADYVEAGGDLTASAAGSAVSFSSSAPTAVSGAFSRVSGSAISTMLDAANVVLKELDGDDTQDVAAEWVVSQFGGISGSAYAGDFGELSENDSTFDAINAAIDAIENRDQLTEESATADAQFAGTHTGALVAAAEKLEAAREGQKDAITKAEGDLTDAQDDLSDLTTAQDDYDAAVSDLEDAQQYFEDNGLELPVSLDGGVTATADNDIFLFNGEESTVGGFGLEGDDQLFIGTDFTWSAIDASVDVAGERTGDAGALEVFAQQDGNNTVLTFENETFAGNAQNGDDLTPVTLTGVNADDLSLNADGFITIA